MPYVPVVRTAMLEYVCTWDGQTVENVYHYQSDFTVTAATLQVLTTGAIAHWNTNIRGLTSSAVSLIAVKATDLSTQTGPVVEDVTGLPLAGTASATAVPNNVTVACKLLTANRGRSFRGRTYFIGLPTGNVTANAVGLTARTNIRNAILLALTLGVSGNWRLVIASKFSGGAPRVNGVATIVTGVTVNPIVDSQRRRLPERGS